MTGTIRNKYYSPFYRLFNFLLVLFFSSLNILPGEFVQAQSFLNLPQPGTMVVQTNAFVPVLIKGIEIPAGNPFSFNFIIDTGDMKVDDQALKRESMRLVKYFLASLTTPEEQMWVNLSPDEETRIIPEHFGKTVMGVDLLAEDYLLKQLASSLMYPEKELGKKFWQRVSKRAYEEYGLKDIPLDSFQRVWIVPKDAEVVQKGNTAFIVKTSLEVLTEEDYFATSKARRGSPDPQIPGSPAKSFTGAQGHGGPGDLTKLQTEVMREIILPEIEKEVNEGKTFARLRQIYNAMVLAAWYKISLKESILGKVYVDRNKTPGIESIDKNKKDELYEQYLKALQKGVFDYIKEEPDPLTGEIIPRRYFSGGFVPRTKDGAMMTDNVRRQLNVISEAGNFSPEQRAKLWAAIGPNSSEASSYKIFINLNPDEADWMVQEPQVKDAFYSEMKQRYSALPRFHDGKLLNALLTALQYNGKTFHDVTLEAILPELKGSAQTATGKGGLGYLAGETDGATHNGIAFMPLYDKTKDGQTINWDQETGIESVMIEDESGKPVPLVLDVEMGGRVYQTKVYWVNRNGRAVFLFRNPEIFNELYPDPSDGEQRMRQYGFIGKAYTALVNFMGMDPDILRLNEAQLLFVQKAVEHDLAVKGEKSLFGKTRTVMTNHTPERAALPIFRHDRGWLASLLGGDLVTDDLYQNLDGSWSEENGRRVIKAAEVLARKSFLIFTVSEEHNEVTKRFVLPEFAWKTTYVQNGSDPDIWMSDYLKYRIEESGFDHITGEDLFNAGQRMKKDLNQWLIDNGFNHFTDLERPLFGAVRRVLEYKEQGIFIAMVRWITGDANKEYETPWGKQKGLAANFLIGGPVSDGVGHDWAGIFSKLQNDPDMKGKLVFINQTGTGIMRLATAASDVWLESPRPTREASGTSHQRALLNGKLVIASSTGGQLSVVKHGQNSWLVDVFQTNGFNKEFDKVAEALDRPDHPDYLRYVERYRVNAQWLFGQYMTEAVDLYRQYKSGQGRRLLDMMEMAFRDAHQKVSITRMIRDMEDVFEHVLDGTGAAGYESRQVAAVKAEVSDEVWDFIAKIFKIDTGIPESLKQFLLGRGPAFDAVNAFARVTQVSFNQAQEFVLASWLIMAYDLDKTKPDELTKTINGTAQIGEGTMVPIRQSWEHLKGVIQWESMLRKIDETDRAGGYVALERYEARKSLADRWAQLAALKENGNGGAQWGNSFPGNSDAQEVGGIDLNTSFLNLKIRRDDKGLPLPANRQPMQEFLKIEGLVPVIINVVPIQNLPMFLGLSGEPGETESANHSMRQDVFDKVAKLD
ncbi:MAG: hypothetical protein AB1650_05670 [Candidatus Omnitrophota bacterium]